MVIPFSDSQFSAEQIFDLDAVRNGMLELSEKMNIDTASAVHYRDGEGGHFLFLSEVKQSGLYLAGTVPEEAVTDGITTITALILWVFGLLILMFAVGMVYLLSAEEKVRESDELREAKKIAEQANHAKSDFLANMSHEIRTPINAIMGMNEMVLRESKDEEIREYAANIQSASKTLLSLINDILDFSKIEAGRMEIIPAPYETAVFFNDVVNMISIKAKQKQLDFQVEIDPGLPSALRGDEVRNRQIIVNILNNAVKYTKQGIVKFFAEGIREDNVFVLKMQVTDSGIGIKKEDLNKLFDGFQRLDLEQNRNIEGTGLGLAITHNLVEQMHGRMDVSSEYGKGSVFTVYLTQEVINDSPMGDFRQKFEAMAKEENEYRESFTAPDAKVLVVDDNEMNLAVVKALLKKTDIQVITCMSGRECLELAAKEYFDVILLDHMMPGMDGIDTLRAMKQSNDHLNMETPIIALTANAVVGAKAEYLETGFSDYLAKPIQEDELMEMIRKYLPPKLTETQENAKQEAADNIIEEKKTLEEKFPALNVQVGLRYCMNDESFFLEMIETYINGDKREVLETEYCEESWKNYQVHVHALKSTSLNIGAEKLSEKVKALELAAKAADYQYIREHHKEVMTEYGILLGELKKAIQ